MRKRDMSPEKLAAFEDAVKKVLACSKALKGHHTRQSAERFVHKAVRGEYDSVFQGIEQFKRFKEKMRPIWDRRYAHLEKVKP